MGAPAAPYWRDAESFADLWSGYYTDREPGSAWVAELNDEVVGYLLGCRDTTRTDGVGVPLRHHLVRRGLAFRPGTAGTIWRAGADLLVDRVRGRPAPQGDVIDERWPAHLHIDLLAEGRGKGLGRRLMGHWLDQLRSEGVHGCHLVTWSENESAIAFFQTMGFRRKGQPVLMAGLRTPTGDRLHTQLLVQDLA
ncbi:MAG: GNAT family N-acetyltransferase [Acidimicrobiales bacterium]